MNVNDKIYGEIFNDMIEQGQTFEDVKESGVYSDNLLMNLEATLRAGLKFLKDEHDECVAKLEELNKIRMFCSKLSFFKQNVNEVLQKVDETYEIYARLLN